MTSMELLSEAVTMAKMAGDLSSSFKDVNSGQGKPLLLTRPVMSVPERNDFVIWMPHLILILCPLSILLSTQYPADRYFRSADSAAIAYHSTQGYLDRNKSTK
jgi:hypothetical protein